MSAVERRRLAEGFCPNPGCETRLTPGPPPFDSQLDQPDEVVQVAGWHRPITPGFDPAIFGWTADRRVREWH